MIGLPQLRMRWLTVVLCLQLQSNAGEVLDRVAVVAGPNVITLSAIQRHLRMRAFLENRPVDVSPEAKREAVELLVNQALLRREIELSRYDPPAMAEVEAQIEKLIKEHNSDIEGFHAHLLLLGLNEDQLKRHLLWAITVFRFTEFRFSQGVQLTEEEVKEYYLERYEKALRTKDPTVAVEALEVVRGTIQQILTNLRANDALKQWLEASRAQMKIRYVEDALK